MKLIIELNDKGDDLISVNFEKDSKIVSWNELTFFEQIGVCSACIACFRFYSNYIKKKK